MNAETYDESFRNHLRSQWEREYDALAPTGRSKARPPRTIQVRLAPGITQEEWNESDKPIWWARVGKQNAFRFLDIRPVAGCKALRLTINLDNEDIPEDEWIYFGVDSHGEKGKVLTPILQEHKSKLPRADVIRLLRLIARLSSSSAKELPVHCAYRTSDCRYLMRQAGLSLADVTAELCEQAGKLIHEEDARIRTAYAKVQGVKKITLIQRGPVKRTGIIGTIRELLLRATESRPITRQQIMDALRSSYPDREEKTMKSTLGTWLTDQKNPKYANKALSVRHDERGFWALPAS